MRQGKLHHHLMHKKSKNRCSQDNMQAKQTAGAKLFQHQMKNKCATQGTRTLSEV